LNPFLCYQKAPLKKTEPALALYATKITTISLSWRVGKPCRGMPIDNPCFEKPVLKTGIENV